MPDADPAVVDPVLPPDAEPVPVDPDPVAEVAQPLTVVAVVAGATLSGLLIMVVDPGFALLAAPAGAVIAALPGPRVDLDTAGRRR